MQIIVLCILGYGSVFWGTSLALAYAGLLLRPFPDSITNKCITYTYWIVLVCFVAISTYNLWYHFPDLKTIYLGCILGFAGFFSHRCITYILCKDSMPQDRKLLAIAQQNGLTSMILALTIYSILPTSVLITAIALIIINGLHRFANRYMYRF